jgi:hypothetical protein
VPEPKVPPPVMTSTTFKTWPVMVGVHVAPVEGAVTVHVLLPMVGDPESVMRMAEVAADVMAVAGVNVTDAVVAVFLIWEPRVTTGPAVMAVKMAGKVPVIDASRKMLPSLVVAAATAVMAACAEAGVVNALKWKAT